MPIPPDLLEIVRCPETMQRLAPAPAELLRRLSDKPAFNRAGKPVEFPIEEGLLREDGMLLYPIRNGIPVLLIDEAISVRVAPEDAR